jgi:hypothetical protein
VFAPAGAFGRIQVKTGGNEEGKRIDGKGRERKGRGEVQRPERE